MSRNLVSRYERVPISGLHSLGASVAVSTTLVFSVSRMWTCLSFYHNPWPTLLIITLKITLWRGIDVFDLHLSCEEIEVRSAEVIGLKFQGQ